MILNGIAFFLSLAASFFLFFFNVPYWTGQDMADMSESGIWRACFRFLSFMGFGCFKLYRTIVGKILDTCLPRSQKHAVKENIRHGIEGLVDVLCSAGVLFLLISGYNRLMDGLFPAGVDALAEGSDGTLLGKLSQAVVFLRVAVKFEAENGGGIVMAAAGTVIAAVQYVAINTLFFSILFGFLQNLLVKMPFFDLMAEKLNIRPAAEREGGIDSQSLPGRLGKATVDFFNKTTVHTFAYNPVSLALFLLALLAYSFVMTWLGKNELGPLDVAWQVLDAIGVVRIAASFFVTWLAAKLGEKAATAVVNVLPQGIQDAIHDASARGNEWVKREDARRRAWAEEHWRDFKGLKKLNLSGSGK